MSKIELKNIGKVFEGGHYAVKDFDLSIEDGEFLTLLGPSGCGKTTILRIIAGLEAPTGGEVLIDGIKANEIPPAERNLAMVFQSYALYPHMSVYDNIAIGLKLRKTPAADINKRVDETGTLLGLEKLLGRKPRALSGGQRQRVALARAIVRHPKAFLLDEPLSNLDATLREKTRSELKKLFTELKITAIYVTHDQVEAMSLSHRIAVINQGELQQVGRPDEIYNKPVNMFVAGFVGSPRINFIRCKLVGNEVKMSNGSSFKIPDKLLPLRRSPYDSSESIGQVKSRELIQGIRPENIHIYPVASKSGLIPAEIVLREPEGPQIVLTLRLDNQEIKGVAPADSHYPDKVGIEFNPARLYLFEPTTEKLINI